MLRWILGVSLREEKSSEEIRKKADIKLGLEDEVKKRKMC